MIEALLTAGSGTSGSSDYGPGPKVFKAGDMQLGYFGEVPAADFVNANLISPLVEAGNDLTQGGATIAWLKFAYKGKILYISKSPLRILPSWNDIYNAGMVYGTKDFGAYPVGAGVMQRKVLRYYEKGQPWYFFPRLMTGFQADPVPAGTVPADDLLNTEFGQLLPRVVQGGGWDTYTAGAVIWASVATTWVQETSASNINNAMTRGSGTQFNTKGEQAKSFNTSNFAQWRPVLELILTKDLKDPYEVAGVTVTPMAASIVTPRQAPAGSIVNPRNLSTLWPTRAPTLKVTPDGVLNPVRLKGDSGTFLNAFAFTAQAADLDADVVNVTHRIAPLNAFSISGATI
jgi:hypothetical protein